MKNSKKTKEKVKSKIKVKKWSLGYFFLKLFKRK